MKTMLPLRERSEPVPPESSKSARFFTNERDTKARYTCDRWGHPYADFLDRKPKVALGRPEIFVRKKMR